MKKITLLMLFLNVFLLAGCTMPFVKDPNSGIETYVKNNNELMSSVDQINKELENFLRQTTNNKKSFDKDSVSERIQISKGVQTDLFKNISEQSVNEKKRDIKTVYLKLMNEYLKTYDIYEKAVKSEKSSVLEAAVKENKIKLDAMKEVYLKELNEKLKTLKIKEVKSMVEKEEK